ncbi:PepSY domain-containing protein [Evansella halocellulosilytica]|uniref:PepSY domain-containing protein n=1 Tax=Evansella halocellulosilytica TaxID=2011013 RepID=UPI000BB6E2B2|nr:PepSY domain-containing protein [Evansella halocellulosilytica]
MKKLTMILTAAFVIGGTSAMTLASNDTSDDVKSAQLNPVTEEEYESAPSHSEEGSSSNDGKISSEEAVEIAKGVLDGKLDEVELDTEDGMLVYEVEIKYNGDDYDFIIDAHSGEIIEIDDDLLKTPLRDEMNVSVEQAKEIALETVPEGKIKEVELERKRGSYVYEIEMKYRGDDGDIYIDATTGDMLKIEDDLLKKLDKEQRSSAEGNKAKTEKSSKDERISREEAGEIALNYIGEGYIDEIELEKEKGHLVYEVEIEYSDDDVDVYVDAYTGEVVYVD